MSPSQAKLAVFVSSSNAGARNIIAIAESTRAGTVEYTPSRLSERVVSGFFGSGRDIAFGAGDIRLSRVAGIKNGTRQFPRIRGSHRA